MDSIEQTIASRTLLRPNFDASEYIDQLRERYRDKLIGIFMYGSMLSDVTASGTSFPDFFVVTDGYVGVFDRWSHLATASPLPPHIFHLRLDEQHRCKYNLISLQRFRRETSWLASDIYILGRFGKRVALIWSRDAAAERALIECCAQAVQNVARWTLRGMQGEFDATDFTLACLNISYAGETRVEATSKVPKLYHAEREYYDNIYPVLLRELPEAKEILEDLGGGRYRVRGSPERLWLRQQVYQLFLQNSRIRGIMRWPKFLLTVDEWVDIILAKIERTKGIKLDPTPRAREHPLLFGWPYFFELLRAGAIGSFKTAPKKDSITRDE